MTAARTLGITLTVAVLLSAGALTYLFNAWKFKKIERRGAQQEVVAATLPVSLEEAAGAVRQAFGATGATPAGCGHEEKFLCALSLYQADDALFPDAFQLRTSAERARDTALKRYAALALEKKQNDFYLYEPTGDYYWRSEYYYNQQPAEFRSGFIVQLEPQEDSVTKIEVYEYLPAIRVGRKLSLNRHGPPVPGFYADIRFVAPTTSDRQAVLRLIDEQVATGSDVLE
jgi:hypothetical protein